MVIAGLYLAGGSTFSLIIPERLFLIGNTEFEKVEPRLKEPRSFGTYNI